MHKAKKKKSRYIKNNFEIYPILFDEGLPIYEFKFIPKQKLGHSQLLKMEG